MHVNNSEIRDAAVLWNRRASAAVRHPACGAQEAGIDAARLASYDRAIRSEPHFSTEQAPGLLHDLSAYLVTLKVRLMARQA